MPEAGEGPDSPQESAALVGPAAVPAAPAPAVVAAATATRSFCVKVLSNAKALLEHSESAFAKLERRRAALDEDLQADLATAARVGEARRALLDAAGRIDDVDPLAAVQDRFRPLAQTLNELKAASVPIWMQPELDDDAPQASFDKLSLLDFVDLGEIDNLRAGLEAEAKSVTQLSDSLRRADAAIASDDRCVAEHVTRLFPRTARSPEFQLGESATQLAAALHQAKANMAAWAVEVCDALDAQRAATDALAQAAGALEDLCTFLAADATDADLVAELPSQPSWRTLEEFCSSDFGASASHTALDRQGVGATGRLQIDSLEHDMQQHLRRALAAVANGVDQIKGHATAMARAKQDYPVRVHEPVQSVLKAALEASERATGLIVKAEALQRQLADRAVEFERLREFYAKYRAAAADAVLPEIRRRWQALAEIEDLARQLQHTLDEKVEAEVRARATFHAAHGAYLPEAICPALGSPLPPTSFRFILANADDAQLLHECVQHLPPTSPQTEQAAPPATESENGVPPARAKSGSIESRPLEQRQCTAAADGLPEAGRHSIVTQQSEHFQSKVAVNGVTGGDENSELQELEPGS